MTVTQILTQLLASQGRTVRSGQAAAAAHIDKGDLHTAGQAPTGVGKSALAVATCVANGSGVIAVNSNGLVAQYAAEAPEWEVGLGIKVAVLVGKAHYHCRKASPTLSGLSAEAKAHVEATGTFIGSGVDPKIAGDDDHRLVSKARKFLAIRKLAAGAQAHPGRDRRRRPRRCQPLRPALHGVRLLRSPAHRRDQPCDRPGSRVPQEVLTESPEPVVP